MVKFTQMAIYYVKSFSALRLDANDRIYLNPGDGVVRFNNNIQIRQDGSIVANSTDLRLAGDNGNVNIDGNLVTANIVSYNDGSDNLIIRSNDLLLQSGQNLLLQNTNTIIGGQQTGTNGRFQVMNGDGYNVFSVNSTDYAYDLPYYGYNDYSNNTPVIRINGFIELSSEGNEANGHLFC
jgi:hypothetical protein